MRKALLSLGEVTAMLTLAAGAVVLAAVLLIGDTPLEPPSTDSPALIRCPITGERIWADDCPLHNGGAR